MHASPDVIEIDNAFMPGASCAAPPACADDGLSAFLSARPRLFGIAYRMLGNAAEAEDIVQDVWIRWQTTDRRPVCNPLAFLVTATTRLAINVLQSAHALRETDVGSSLPEPVDTSADPALGAERGEALNLAVQLLLERLSPTERAAYVLREAFNHPYRQIAGILRVEEANARQLVTRAREHVSGRRRAPVSPARQRCLLNAFVAAARTGDLARLERLFTSDVASTSDGGGFVRAAAASRPSRGRRQVQRRRRGTHPERRDSRVHAVSLANGNEEHSSVGTVCVSDLGSYPRGSLTRVRASQPQRSNDQHRSRTAGHVPTRALRGDRHVHLPACARDG